MPTKNKNKIHYTIFLEKKKEEEKKALLLLQYHSRKMDMLRWVIFENYKFRSKC